MEGQTGKASWLREAFELISVSFSNSAFPPSEPTIFCDDARRGGICWCSMNHGVFQKGHEATGAGRTKLFFLPVSIMQWGLREYVIVHTILGGSPVILWISLGDKPK